MSSDFIKNHQSVAYSSKKKCVPAQQQQQNGGHSKLKLCRRAAVVSGGIGHIIHHGLWPLLTIWMHKEELCGPVRVF